MPLRYRLGDIPSILASPGRRFVIDGALYTYSRPILAPLAALHRRALVRRTRIATVVGSFGKTTTARAVSAALDLDPEAPINATHGSRLFLGILAIRPGQRRAVLEVGIDGFGQMRQFAEIVRPDLTVVTGIGSEHGRTFVSLEATRDEKAAMLRALGSAGVAIVNGDDPHVRWMATQTAARVRTVGLGPQHDVWADEIRLDWPVGTVFRLHIDGQTRTARTRLLGAHQVRAVLAAVAVAMEEGGELDAALERLASLPPTPGRLDPVALANGAVLLRDEFKSAVETIDAALDVLAEIPARRKIVVLGQISEPPPAGQNQLYRRLGARVGAIASRFITLGHRRHYATGARQAGLDPAAITHVRSDFRQVVELLRDELQAGDVVLIKGRDTQRMERIALALQGSTIGCNLVLCRVNNAYQCDRCPILERGWGGQMILP